MLKAYLKLTRKEPSMNPNDEQSQPNAPAAPQPPAPDAASTTTPIEVKHVFKSDPIATDQPASPVSYEGADEPIAPLVPQKSKKKLVIGLIIGGFLALLTGGGTLAYALWYQNPDKVAVDGLLSLVTAKSGTVAGTLTVSQKDFGLTLALDSKSSETAGAGKVTATVEIKSGTLAGREISVAAESVVVKEGDLYFKLTNLQKAADDVVDTYVAYMAQSYKEYGMAMTDQQIADAKAEMKKEYDPIVKKLDGQWVKVAAADMKDVDEEAAKAQECVTDALAKLQNEPALKRELTTVYRQNKFVVIKQDLGVSQNSQGYLIEVDADKLKTFGEKAEATEFGKLLAKCDKDSGVSENLPSQDDIKLQDGRFELWVNRWNHKLTGIKAQGKVDAEGDTVEAKLDLTFNLDVPVTVDIPQDVMTWDELQKDIEQAMNAEQAPESGQVESLTKAALQATI